MKNIKSQQRLNDARLTAQFKKHFQTIQESKNDCKLYEIPWTWNVCTIVVIVICCFYFTFYIANVVVGICVVALSLLLL